MEVVRSQSGFGGSLREPAGDGHCGDRSGASQRCGATSSTQIFIYSILRHGVPRKIMSEDTKSSDYRYPRFGDQQDWRKWTQKAKPKLYAIQSKAEPEKTVYQMFGRDGGRGRSEAVRAEQLWESGGRKIGSCWLLEREKSPAKKGPGRDRPLQCRRPTRADGVPRVAPGLPCSPRLLGWRPLCL